MSEPKSRLFTELLDAREWQRICTMMSQALHSEVHTLGPDGQDLCPPIGVCPFVALLEALPVIQAAEAAGERFVVCREDEHGVRLIEDVVSGLLGFELPVRVGGEDVALVTATGRLLAPVTPELAARLVVGSDITAEQLIEVSRSAFPGERDMLMVTGQLCSSFLRILDTEKQHRVEAEELTRQVATLARVGRIVSKSIDLTQVLEALIDEIPPVMHVDGCLIGLLDDDGVMRIKAYRGVGPEYAKMEFSPHVGLCGTVLATGRPINVPNMNDDPRTVYRDLDCAERLQAMLAVPLRDGDDVLGVLAVYRRSEGVFTAAEEQLLRGFGEYSAAAVRNALLYERIGRAHNELGRATSRLRDVQDRMVHHDRLVEVGRIAGGAAHEMRNTIGGIIGAAATVRDHLDRLSEADVRELVAAIADEGWRLRDTLEEVRGYAKPRHLGTGQHLLGPVIDEAVRLMHFDPAYAHLRIAAACEPDVTFTGDRDRLKQVLLNLLRNAADAVRGIEGREPVITVTASLDGDKAQILVADNGVGIPDELLPRIWEPFFTTKGAAGTGLGLDMVRQIVEAQDGSINAASQVDVGTTFSVRLPGRRQGSEEVAEQS